MATNAGFGLAPRPGAAAASGLATRLSTNAHMLGRERSEAVLPDRALYLPTFGHFLILNKTSLYLSLRARSL